jgi:hypothetical protein
MLRGTSYSSPTGFTSPAASSELLLRSVSILEEFCQLLQLEPGSDLEVEGLMRAVVIADLSLPAEWVEICAEMIELCEEVTVVGLQTVSGLVIRADVQQVLDAVVNVIDDTARPTAQAIAKEICTDIIERMLASCTTQDCPTGLIKSQSDVSNVSGEFVVPLTLDMNDEPVVHTEMVVEIVEVVSESAGVAADAYVCALHHAVSDAPASYDNGPTSHQEDVHVTQPHAQRTSSQDDATRCILQMITVQHSQPTIRLCPTGTEPPVHFDLEAVVQQERTHAAQLQCGTPTLQQSRAVDHADQCFTIQEETLHGEAGRSSEQYRADEHQANVTAERLTPYFVSDEAVGGELEHPAIQPQDQRERSRAAVVECDQLAQNQQQEQVQLSQPAYASQHCTQENPGMPQDGEKEQQRQAEEHAAFEQLWQTEKTAVERRAEVRATAQFRQWQRDKVTLEAAIEATLRDYAELYEKVRLFTLLIALQTYTLLAPEMCSRPKRYGYSSKQRSASGRRRWQRLAARTFATSNSCMGDCKVLRARDTGGPQRYLLSGADRSPPGQQHLRVLIEL